jgi:hypothetical protein
VEHAVTVFYGGKEAYGFHALEALQCMVERRKGGETGIASVECVEGPAVWTWTDAQPWAARLLDAALARSETKKPGSPRENARTPILFRLHYRSGLAAALYILNGHCQDCTFAADIKGRSEPAATQIWLQSGRPYSHFSALAHYIEQMIVTGREPYPPERTLLTTGILDAAMDSRLNGGTARATPERRGRRQRRVGAVADVVFGELACATSSGAVAGESTMSGRPSASRSSARRVW